MRRTDRMVTDEAKILEILQKAKVVHVAFMDEDYPYLVPLHYGFEFVDGHLVFYMHGAKEGRKLDLIRKNNKVCVEAECNVEMISGGETACRYGSSYASVIGNGKAEIVENTEEKIHGLDLLMKNQTGREFPMTAQMAETVAVIKITVEEFTAKSRV